MFRIAATHIFSSALLCLLPSISFASYIAIVPETEQTVQSKEQKVEISFTLHNEGDEPAKEVTLSFPTLNRGKMVTNDLSPKTAAKETLSFSFAELGLSLEGSYILPYQVVYRDANYYALSSPQLVTLQLGEVPSKVLVGIFDGLDTATSIELSKSASLSLNLMNAIAAPLKISSIAIVSANEVQAQLHPVQLPAEIAAQGDLRVELSLKNLTALLDSSYATWVVVQGESAGKHFAEPFSFVAHIVAPSMGSYALMRIIVIALGVILALGWAIRSFLRPRSNTNSSSSTRQ